MLTEQSVAGLGRSYAGIGVDGTDISGVYYNPATMTLHKGTILQAGFVGIGLNLDYAARPKTVAKRARRFPTATSFTRSTTRPGSVSR